MESLTIALSVIAILIACYYYYLKNLNVFKRYGIPHIPPKPIVGNLGPVLTMKCSMVEMVKKVYNLDSEAKYVGFYDLGVPMIYIRDVELVKAIGMKNFDHFQDHLGFFDTSIDTLFGGALFFLHGEHWKNQRSAVTPIFTSSKIKNMFKLMTDCGERITNYLVKLPEEEREIEMKSVLSKYTNDVIASCAFGIEVDSVKDPNNDLYVNGQRSKLFVGFGQFIKMLMYRNVPSLIKLLRIRFFAKNLADFYENLLLDTVKIREEKGIYRPDMLQVMIDAKNKNEPGKTLTISDVTSNAYGFYFGAYETVSMQTSFVFHLLAEHPNVQTKLQEEIDKVLEEHDGQLTYDIVTKMEYLEAVIHETMRLYPNALFLDRVCTKTYELPPAVPGAKPYTLRPGMNLWIPVCAIHTDSKHYENPDKFEPERFVNDGKRILNSGAFIPFGLGPRMCIGHRFAMMKMKVIVCQTLSRCQFKLSSKSQLPMEILKGSIAVTPKNGFWLKVEPRKNVNLNSKRTVSNSA